MGKNLPNDDWWGDLDAWYSELKKNATHFTPVPQREIIPGEILVFINCLKNLNERLGKIEGDA